MLEWTAEPLDEYDIDSLVKEMTEERRSDMMNKEYIERDKILPAIEAYIELPTAYENIEREIGNIPPAADVAPVVHGEWVMKETLVRSPFAKNAYCSECFEETGCCYNYCPNCGAKMGGGGHGN